MTNKTIEDILKEFDNIFYEPPSLYMGSAFGDPKLDKAIKAFIEQAIATALEVERERIKRQVLSSISRQFGEWSITNSGIEHIDEIIRKWCDPDYL